MPGTMVSKTAEQMVAPLVKLAGEKETGSGNNTTVNKYFNQIGTAYCGYSLMYADRLSGKGVLDGCANAAYCPTLAAFLDQKYTRLKDNTQAKKGDIAIYHTSSGYQHTFFIYEKVSGTTFITLEGNSMVYDTVAKAKASTAGSGAYEGIGFKKRNMPSGSTWQIWSIPYSDSAPKYTLVNAQVREIKKGDSGEAVNVVMQALKDRKYYTAAVDYDFGPKMLEAVKAYQKANGLTVDGIWGKQCWGCLLGR